MVFTYLFLKRNTYAFSDMDNTDFSEDTPDRKDTLHRTITVVNRRTGDGENISQPFQLEEVKKSYT